MKQLTKEGQEECIAIFKARIHYIVHEGGDQNYYFSDEKPVWDAGCNTWSIVSKAWMEGELFERLYPAIATRLAKAKTRKEGIVKVHIEKGIFRIVE